MDLSSALFVLLCIVAFGAMLHWLRGLSSKPQSEEEEEGEKDDPNLPPKEF